MPAGARHLHYLLFTPFRYAPPPGGSRFRGPTDPGVFYGADEVRTACAELGYWRWRHLARHAGARRDAGEAADGVSRGALPTHAVDLRAAPFDARSRAVDASGRLRRVPAPCARAAREGGVGAIRYESVRDPQHGGCCAVLDPAAFARPTPLEQQTWMLSVTRERVVWQRTDVSRGRRTSSRRPLRRGRSSRTRMSAPVRGPRARPHRLRRHVARDAAFTAREGTDTADELWLTEHPPIYTLGLAGRREHVLRDNGIPVAQGRPRRAGHLSRAGPAGRLHAGGPAPRAAGHPRDGPEARGRGDRMA